VHVPQVVQADHGQGLRVAERRATPAQPHGNDHEEHSGGRCCVGEEEADSSLSRQGSDGEGKFGEDRLKPAAGLSIVSEFVVAAAQVLNESVPATDHLGAAEPL
jgi:hypothetical protein